MSDNENGLIVRTVKKTGGLVRYLVSTACLLGTAPHYITLWMGWRALSVFTPGWVYQKGDDICYTLYQSLVVFFFEHVTGLEVWLSGDVEVLEKRERVLYLSNHQSTVDWIISDMVAVRCGRLGQLRYVMKSSLQWLPLYGWYFHEHGCIFVKRGSFNSKKMLKALNYLDNPKIPSWMVVFPEGTRYNPEMDSLLDRSKEAAVKQNLPPLQHHLTPKITGSLLTLNSLRHNLDAVYDITVMYQSSWDGSTGRRFKAPQLIDFLRGKCPRVFLHIRRIPIAQVPEDKDNLQKWMHSLFLEKDKVAEELLSKPGDSFDRERWRLHRLGLHHTLPSLLLFSVLSLPYVLLNQGRRLYLQTWLFGTLFGYSWMFFQAVA